MKMLVCVKTEAACGRLSTQHANRLYKLWQCSVFEFVDENVICFGSFVRILDFFKENILSYCVLYILMVRAD